ncbi:universal stress protein [Antarcticibacterium arcticum]|uniref:Universal stress protein n=1 Tax=Antarcticibacterium arcticum TaxID=2585771 RepID=A0A5B8YHS0_9FLAO|nr:universal stress protein [Antarcticibacterium arcticum]QED36578.1 universal stress protein [Antarcticibacterium arcticum]
MKTILLPTDFSDNALNAAVYAINLYRRETCHFIFLNAYNIEGYFANSLLMPEPAKHILEQAKKDSIDKLQDLVNNLEIEYSNLNHNFTTVSQNDHLVPAINLQIESAPVEAVIIGTQGNTAAHDVAFGRNTKNIMEEVRNCPILAIPSHVKYKGLNEVVLPTSYKMDFRPEDFSFIKRFLSRNNASLRVLHIEETTALTQMQKDKKQALEAILKSTPHSFHHLANVSIPIGIYTFTESRGSDMIAFLNKKHSFFENILLEPLYKNLGNYSQIPVLVLQLKREEY